MNKHFLTIRGKVTGISKSLSPIIKSNTLFIENKLLFNNAYFRSILIHACPISYFVSKTNMEYPNRAYKKNLRIIKNGHRYFRNTTILRYLCTISLKHVSGNSQKTSIKLFIIFPMNSSQNCETMSYPTLLIAKRPR